MAFLFLNKDFLFTNYYFTFRFYKHSGIGNHMNAKSIIMLILIGIFIVFCLQNVENITIHFIFWSFAISKLLILILTFIIGIFIGILIPGMMTKKSKPENKQHENKASN